MNDVFIHDTAIVDQPVDIGSGTKDLALGAYNGRRQNWERVRTWAKRICRRQSGPWKQRPRPEQCFYLRPCNTS